jgi:uncharacterized protein YecT (DUF1311 family)
MKRLAWLLLIAFTSLPCLAQDYSEQFRNCIEKAFTQSEITVCAGEEAKRSDAELNAVYQKLLLQAAGQQNAVAKITAAERAWITYRDAYIEAMLPAENKQAEYGTIHPSEVSLLRAKLTRLQITALNELLAQYAPSKR